MSKIINLKLLKYTTGGSIIFEKPVGAVTEWGSFTLLIWV